MGHRRGFRSAAMRLEESYFLPTCRLTAFGVVPPTAVSTPANVQLNQDDLPQSHRTTALRWNFCGWSRSGIKRQNWRFT